MSDGNVEILTSIQGMQLKEAFCQCETIEGEWPETYGFAYAACCYLLFFDMEPLKLYSIDMGSDYAIFAEVPNLDEMESIYENLSDYMYVKTIYKGAPNLVTSVLLEELDGQILSVNIKLENGQELHVVSGEYLGTLSENEIRTPDEMLLIFDSREKAVVKGLT